jgi:hypothetical protein
MTTYSNPSVLRFVNIANDGKWLGSPGTAIVDASHGVQNKVCRHNNNVIRMVYTQLGSTSPNYIPSWRLMKSTDDGVTWIQEALIPTVEEPTLLRDNRSDESYVISYNTSYQLCIWTSRDNFTTAVPVPGSWQQLTGSDSHYYGAGIAMDGTIVIQETDETTGYINQPTDSANYAYIVCRWETGRDSWGANENVPGTWSFSRVKRTMTGLRYTYPHVFVKPTSNLSSRFYGITRADINYLAAGYTSLTGSTYVFHGQKYYSEDLTSLNDFKSLTTGINDPAAGSYNGGTPTFDPRGYWMDKHGRLFVTVESRYTNSIKSDGSYLRVYDCNKEIDICEQYIPTAGTSNYVKIFQDASDNFYMLKLANAPTACGLYLSRMLEVSNPSRPWQKPKFTFPNKLWDLSSVLGTLCCEYTGLRLAQNNSGNVAQDNFIDCQMLFVDQPYSGSPLAPPSPQYTTGGMRVYYAKIQLS